MTSTPAGLEFEAFSHSNGQLYWSARELMTFLGYSDWGTFRRRVIERAWTACLNLDLPVSEHFRDTKAEIDGKQVPDLQLTRFACFLVAQNGDSKKREVARVQGYFAALAEAFREHEQESDEVERLLLRGEITEDEKALVRTAKSHLVENFAYFVNSGYQGMYGMGISRLRQIKGVPSNRSPLDYMRPTELAANQFRITQTDEKIRNDNIQGQRALEVTAEHVGRTVRNTMIELSGTAPESLPAGEDLKLVKSDLRRASRGFTKIDKGTVR